MRPGRLILLVGTLLAAAALYLKHLAVDPATFALLTGGSVPTIWQELGRWGRPVAALLAAGLVAVAFRPGAGGLDRWGGVAGVLPIAGAIAGCVLTRQAAAGDAEVVSAALGQAVTGAGGAGVGAGFWVLIGGAGLAGAGLVWDLAAAWRGEAGDGGGGPASVGEQDPAALE